MIAVILTAGLVFAPSSPCDTIRLVDTTYVSVKGGEQAVIDTSFYAVCPIEESLRASEKKLKAIEVYIRARKKGK